MKILIIGCGYLGKTVATKLAESLSLTCTKTSAPCSIAGVHFELLKPSTYTKLPKLIKDIDVIIVTLAAKDKASYRETYLGLARALKKALLHLPHITIICTSSTGVYKEECGSIVNEAGILDLERADILIETEKTYLSLRSHRVVVARLSGLYGTDRPIKKWYEQAIDKPLWPKYTNTIEVQEAAAFICYALKYPIRGLFNISTRTALNIDLFKEVMLKSPLLATKAQDNPHGGSKQIDSTKAKCLPYFSF